MLTKSDFSGRAWTRVRRADGCLQRRSGRAGIPAGKPVAEHNKDALKALVDQGTVPGFLGYRNGKPIAWVSLGPREDYAKLAKSPVMKPVDDKPVWSVICFYTALEARGEHIAETMLEHAAESRARPALEHSRHPKSDAHKFQLALPLRALPATDSGSLSHKTRIAATTAAVVGFAAIVFLASLLILPCNVTPVTTRERDIEEWSPAEFETAATTLTPKGMAAAALAPTENLEQPPRREAATPKGAVGKRTRSARPLCAADFAGVKALPLSCARTTRISARRPARASHAMSAESAALGPARAASSPLRSARLTLAPASTSAVERRICGARRRRRARSLRSARSSRGC